MDEYYYEIKNSKLVYENVNTYYLGQNQKFVNHKKKVLKI